MGLRDISHPVCFHTHTEPTPKHNAGSSWIANAIDACCVSARAALRVSAPVAMAAANGARPAASVRLFCVRLDRGDTTCLHLAAWVALFAHAPGLLAWLRQRHQARRIGSLLVQAPSSGRRAPCRGVVALLAHATRLPPWLRQRRQPCRVGSLFVRCRVRQAAASPSVRRCAGRPAIAFGKRLPSRPSATRHTRALLVIIGLPLSAC